MVLWGYSWLYVWWLLLMVLGDHVIQRMELALCITKYALQPIDLFPTPGKVCLYNLVSVILEKYFSFCVLFEENKFRKHPFPIVGLYNNAYKIYAKPIKSHC